MTRKHEKELYEKYEDICNQHKYCADCHLYRGNDGKTLSKCDCIFCYQKGMKEFAEKLKEKCFEKCSEQDEENFQYPSYLELGDIYKIVDGLLKEMRCRDE